MKMLNFKDFLPKTKTIEQENNDKCACLHCGKHFDAKNKTQKFCSKECRTEFNKPRDRQRKKDEYYYVPKEKSTIKKSLGIFHCLTCGKEHPRKSHSQKYCSIKCRHLAWAWENIDFTKATIYKGDSK